MNLIGKTIGNYQIVEEIGRGGMGIVYRAQQPSLNRWVAIKVLAPSLEQDAEFFKRFKQEAVATAALDHPNVIHVYDTGEEQGLHYIVMEYISGGNLFARMKANSAPVPAAEAVSIASQVAMALDFAHRRGIVHRDVKPSNILLDSEGRAVLTDLGISRALEEATRLTRTGITLGTPEYMSPEQAQGKALDGRADLYSLGVILFEMLTGRIPFQADAPLALLYKHIHEAPPNPRKLNPKIPGKLSAVSLKALAKDPAKRFATGQQMLATLLSSVPGARIQYSAREATIPKITYTPKEIALNTLGKTRNVVVGATRAVGLFLLRFAVRMIEALVAVVLLVVILTALLAVAFSFFVAQYAQNTLRDSYWDYSLLSPTRPYQVTASNFARDTAPSVEQRTFGTIRNASISFASPDRVLLSVKVLGNSVALDGTVFTKNGIPQLQLQHLNNTSLPVIDNIISNGINQGVQESWANAPVRVTRFTVVDDATLRVETANK